MVTSATENGVTSILTMGLNTGTSKNRTNDVSSKSNKFDKLI